MKTQVKKAVKVIKQAGLKTKIPVVKKVIKVKRVSKNNFFTSFPKFEEVSGYIKKPEYLKIKALQEKNQGFNVRVLGGGCKRLMSAYYANKFKKGICNVLEIPELRNSVNFSDRAVLLALGKIEDTGSITGSIRACQIELVKGSARKCFKIKIK